MQLTRIVLSFASVVSLAGCSQTSAVSVSASQQLAVTRDIVGTALIGAQGKTPEDQIKIDDTVAGVCGARVWKKSECLQHDQMSREGPR
jgi:1-aminocyclopropane-1-carboxylate deaminase/D-cysteine desulfhydrase-like pyridoxal-dependent ACC family enzyme